MNHDGLLWPGERLDDLQVQGLRLIQDPSRFCFGMDAVLLASFAGAGEREQVLDLCCGTGIVPVLMSAKTRAAHLTGLELFAQNADLARRNVVLNHLEERLDILQGDVKAIRSLVKGASFAVVTCNPPYIKELPPAGKHDPLRLAARHEIHCNLDDIAAAAAYALKSSGRFYLVHRPYRLAEIIRTLGNHHLEPKRMRLVYPYSNKEPNMVLLEATKGGRSGMRLEPPLVVYEKAGVYTREILDIYGMAPSDGPANKERS